MTAAAERYLRSKAEAVIAEAAAPAFVLVSRLEQLAALSTAFVVCNLLDAAPGQAFMQEVDDALFARQVGWLEPAVPDVPDVDVLLAIAAGQAASELREVIAVSQAAGDIAVTSVELWRDRGVVRTVGPAGDGSVEFVLPAPDERGLTLRIEGYTISIELTGGERMTDGVFRAVALSPGDYLAVLASRTATTDATFDAVRDAFAALGLAPGVAPERRVVAAPPLELVASVRAVARRFDLGPTTVVIGSIERGVDTAAVRGYVLGDPVLAWWAHDSRGMVAIDVEVSGGVWRPFTMIAAATAPLTVGVAVAAGSFELDVDLESKAREIGR